ncbi:hypothetical protein RhiirA4_458261 [Rhizophagus irregularis]|uniref:Uncharacterized protein n=1 Tax=Rhizophagus irregularis TaxID=588596 RepID=A0A2I1GBT8_9GLOM|nr:hypothetical protein RhiirA4_458261 [Rhizophagus irregularis]
MFRSKVLLPLMRYYQDRFKNFYATAIQQAWINCKKRSNHWHIKYDGTSSEKKAIHCDKDYYFINEKIIEFNVADRFHDLAEKKKLIAQQGYRLKNPSGWVDMTKWVQNPDYLNSKVSNSRSYLRDSHSMLRIHVSYNACPILLKYV